MSLGSSFELPVGTCHQLGSRPSLISACGLASRRQLCRQLSRSVRHDVCARAATSPSAKSSTRAANWNPGTSGSVSSVDAATPTTSSTKTFASFEKMLDQSELPVLVDFHAHWCGPCQMMGHVLSDVSKRLDGAVTCVRIDCDKYPALASEYNVQALPTLVLFKNGKPIDKVEGYVGLQSLLDRVNYYLGRRMGPGRSFKPSR